MKALHLLFILSVLLGTSTLTSCSNANPVAPTPTSTSVTVQQSSTKTPTPTQSYISGIAETPEVPVIPLSGILEIRFPDPFGRSEFCVSNVPYTLTRSGDKYTLDGKGKFECHNTMTFEQGFKQHLEQAYDVDLTGSMPGEPEAILQINLQFTGEQDGYFSDLPPKVPEFITSSDPFHVEIDETILLKFSYTDGAYCLWNNTGVFTSLPGEEPPVGENGWLFILHPGK